MRPCFEKYYGKYNLRKNSLFPFSEVDKGSTIVLYGAGTVGQSYYRQVLDTEYCNILLWVDSKYAMYSQWGIDVKPVDYINEAKYDYVVIAVESSVLAREINRYLLSVGISQEKIIWNAEENFTVTKGVLDYFYEDAVIYCAKEVLEHRNIGEKSAKGLSYLADAMNMAEDKEKLIIPRIVIEMTTWCTLHCKGCNNLMPMYKHPEHLNYVDVINDFEKLLISVDKIMILELIGGEPFCYPYINEVIDYVTEIDKVDMIQITTNGTIVPNGKTLEKLKNEKICVRISKYKDIDINALVTDFDAYNIRYTIMDELIWTDSGNVSKRNRPREELQSVYARCPSARFCKTLYKGKIFPCARAASLYDLGFNTDENQYVSLRDDIKEELRDFILRTYASACDYCDAADSWRQIEAGQQD